MKPFSRRALMGATSTALAAAALWPGPALAGTGQVSVIQDDDNILYGSDRARDRTLDLMKVAGVDVVRATVKWEVLAPRRRRPGFDGRNPRRYSSAVWNRFDRFVLGAYLRGMYPYLNVTWPGPEWARGRAPTRRIARLGSYRPNRVEFAKFAEAVGRRYSGSYRDENDGRRPLPKVLVWSIGNEPNQGGWLTPQWTESPATGRPVPTAPRLYRELYYSGRAALGRTGHENDTIMFGELAPIGRSDRGPTSPIHPGRFLREMFCLDERLRPYTGASARLRGCQAGRLATLRAKALAYHPYSPDRSPEQRPGNPDEFNMATLRQLVGLLDRISSRTGRLPAGQRLWLTEYGYESSPPDPFHGISLAKQAEWLNLGEFLAYRNPRVDAQSQFLFRDAKPFARFKRNSKPYWLSYQSGILFQNYFPKPSFYAYLMPLHLQRVGTNVNVWGQVRFRPNTPPHTAEVQLRLPNTVNWMTLGTATTNNPLGFYEKLFPIPASGFFRVVWRDAGGIVRAFSREIYMAKL